MDFLLQNPKISFFKVFLLWIFLPTSSLQAGKITTVRSGAGYVLLLGQLHNHFANSLGLAAEGSYQTKENTPWSLPAGIFYSKLTSDDAHQAYLMHYLTVSGGIGYDIPHRPWYHSRFSIGLSLLRWVLVSHHPQVLMETDHGLLLGLYGEAVQEIRFYERWAAEFFIRPQYPEPKVANLLIEIGLRLAYAI